MNRAGIDVTKVTIHSHPVIVAILRTSMLASPPSLGSSLLGLLAVTRSQARQGPNTPRSEAAPRGSAASTVGYAGAPSPGCRNTGGSQTRAPGHLTAPR